MYAGTAVYFALRIRNLSHDMAAVYTNVVALFIDLQACYLNSVGGSTQQCSGTQDTSDLAGPSDLPPQYCAGTAALTINVGILCPFFLRFLRSHRRSIPNAGCTRERDPLLARLRALAPQAHNPNHTLFVDPRDLWCVS